MILTCVSHGRRDSDARRLASHLSKATGQVWRIAACSGINAALSLGEIFSDLRRTLALSTRAAVGFHHVTINPSSAWTEGQRDAAIKRILDELGAHAHSWVAVEHAGKPRAMKGGADTHWHLVIAHVGPDGRALNMSASFARLEAIARICEYDASEPVTPSRRRCAVARHLLRMGRPDVAELVGAPTAPIPRSAMTSQSRQRAARFGLNLPAARAAVRAAWESPDLAAALAAAGLRLGWGDRRPIPIIKVEENGSVVGALYRLAGVTRNEAVSRLEAEMAKRKLKQQHGEGDGDERKDDRRRVADAGAARTTDMAGRRRHKGDGDGDSGNSDAGRTGLARPRFARPNRGHAANADHDSASARRRRQRAVIELRQAEAAARRRARRGRRFVADVEEAKAALWQRLFGAELSPNLIAALAYVDVQERLVKLTNGGWVRDEGDRLIASGADSAVVALLVEAAKAKGWKSVRIWGAEDFIKEARCQFEAVGIPVIVVDPPPASMVQRADETARQPDADAVIAELVQSRIDAEVRLARVIRPEPEPKSVIDARAKEREADAAWRTAIRRHDEARVALEEAECQMQDAGIFAKYGAKKRLAKAREQFEICSERLRELLDAHKRAKVWLDDRQAAYERAEARRRADRVSWERRARADVEFAAACERVATESRGLALKGVRAVEQAAYERLLSRRAGDETPSATEDEAATSVTIPP